MKFSVSFYNTAPPPTIVLAIVYFLYLILKKKKNVNIVFECAIKKTQFLIFEIVKWYFWIPFLMFYLVITNVSLPQSTIF